jgi:peptidyl-prolyl cis-trans isomerase SurA
MVPEFIKAIAELNEPSEISPPVRTAFGWHIIRLLEKQQPEGDEALTDLRNRISRDSRSQLSQKVVIDRIKNETGFTENLQSVESFYDIVDESIFQGRWSLQHEFNPDKEIFSFADLVVNQSDFANYIQQNQSMRSPESIRNYVNAAYADFVKKKLLDYEESMLEVKYPEFKKIMREYHDGILLFELTDQKVWSMAMQDTAGLKEFYQQNIQNYMWNDRLEGVVYTFSSESLAKSARPQIRRLHRRKQSHEALVNELNENSQLSVTAEKGLFERDQKPVLNQVTWKKGVSPVFKWNEMFYIVQVKDVLPTQPKKLNEIRGLVIADYQNYLEEKWITELRQKYNYSVNKELLQALNIE